MTRAILLAVLLLPAIATAAIAHGPGLPVGPNDLAHHWSLEAATLAPLALAHWLYGRGMFAARARVGDGRLFPPLRVAAFLGGEAALVIALVSPLDPLAGTLFSAHMLQHALLMLVAAPLLVFGRAGLAFFYAAPAPLRRRLTRASGSRALLRLGRSLADPFVAAAAHGASIWLWHAPALFERALASDAVHWLEHVCLLAGGVLFFRAAAAARGPAAEARVAIAAFLTMAHTGLLGALLVLAPAPLYPWYVGRTDLWNLDALADQQWAGLIMWGPMAVAYAVTCGLALSRLIGPATPASVRVAAARPATALPAETPR